MDIPFPRTKAFAHWCAFIGRAFLLGQGQIEKIEDPKRLRGIVGEAAFSVNYHDG
jgi:hypothetical protein